MATATQVVQAAKRNMTDETKLNCDLRNPFVIWRGQKDVSCPCTARFLPTQEENVCAVCDIAVIGVDGTGLLALLYVLSPVINSDR